MRSSLGHAKRRVPTMPSDIYHSPAVTALIDRALEEDLGPSGDCTVTALVEPSARLSGVITAKQAGVVCGLAILAPVMAAVADRQGTGPVALSDLAPDGTAVQPGTVVARLEGDAGTILMGERSALNIAQRLSGCATVAAACAALVAGTRAQVYDTRKTTPGMRALEKHAVVCGGCCNHRQGLFDQILIKENHIALMGADNGPAAAVRRAKERSPGVLVEVEIENLDDLAPVIAAGADIVLLDNMDCPALRQAVAIRSDAACELEASGGITRQNLRAVAETGVDRISIGALTHSVAALDLSLRCTVMDA